MGLDMGTNAANGLAVSAVDELDAFMEELGLIAQKPKPKEYTRREDRLLDYIQSGEGYGQRLSLLCHWLQHHMALYWHMVDHYKYGLSPTDFAAMGLSYYLDMAFLPWFVGPKQKGDVGIDSLPPCDKKVTIELILALSRVQATIKASEKR
jgi:hypothetical protein